MRETGPSQTEQDVASNFSAPTVESEDLSFLSKFLPPRDQIGAIEMEALDGDYERWCKDHAEELRAYDLAFEAAEKQRAELINSGVDEITAKKTIVTPSLSDYLKAA